MRVMDLICLRCGEPWSLDDVLFEIREEFNRTGCAINRCPCCMAKQKVHLDVEHQQCLNDLAVAAELFGNDYVAFAAFLEDMHFT